WKGWRCLTEIKHDWKLVIFFPFSVHPLKLLLRPRLRHCCRRAEALPHNAHEDVISSDLSIYHVLCVPSKAGVDVGFPFDQLQQDTFFGCEFGNGTVELLDHSGELLALRLYIAR